jgi:signal peptidase I
MKTATLHDRKRTLINSIRGFISFVVFVAAVAIAALVINQYIFQAYYVDGTSMTPTLQNNDRLIVDKLTKTFDNLTGKEYLPARGDIVTFDSSLVDQSGQGEQLIKRVIGLPGDTVSIANGIVTITNKQHPEGFDADKTLGLHLVPTSMEEPFSATVPANSIFVMGDNRAPSGSFDSRFFGPVPVGKIEGKLVMRIFPFNAWKTF